MTEAVEFDVPEAGAPNLGGEGQESAYDQQAAAQVQVPVIVTGWQPDEAARVIGGMVAGLTTVLYVMRHQAPPAAELVPYIAGDPPREFPLLGMSLAPILDVIAPKGSAAAVGVGLGAGISELMGAMARRLPVISTPPPDKQQAPRPQEKAKAAPVPDPGGFSYSGDHLRVLQQAEGAYAGVGVDVG